MSRRLAACFTAVLCCSAAPAAAGDLLGLVADRTGGVLPGAIVRVLNALGIQLSAVPKSAA